MNKEDLARTASSTAAPRTGSALVRGDVSLKSELAIRDSYTLYRHDFSNITRPFRIDEIGFFLRVRCMIDNYAGPLLTYPDYHELVTKAGTTQNHQTLWWSGKMNIYKCNLKLGPFLTEYCFCSEELKKILLVKDKKKLQDIGFIALHNKFIIHPGCNNHVDVEIDLPHNADIQADTAGWEVFNVIILRGDYTDH